MPEERKTIPPKVVPEFWNLMSFDENRESGWRYNNTLENKLMRPREVCLEYKFVALHRASTYRYLQRGGGHAALCTHVRVSVRCLRGWQPHQHRAKSPFCPVLVRHSDTSVTLSRSLLERKIRSEQTSLLLGDLWPCTCSRHGGRATIIGWLIKSPDIIRIFQHLA